MSSETKSRVGLDQVKDWQGLAIWLRANALPPYKELLSALGSKVEELASSADTGGRETLLIELRAIAESECARYEIDGINTWRMVERILERVWRDSRSADTGTTGAEGLRMLDGKFGITNGGKLVKASSGEESPAWEPLHIMRARDRLSLPLLRQYREISVNDGCNEYHLAGVDAQIERFEKFEREHPEWMKQPGVTKGAVFVPDAATQRAPVTPPAQQFEALREFVLKRCKANPPCWKRGIAPFVDWPLCDNCIRDTVELSKLSAPAPVTTPILSDIQPWPEYCFECEDTSRCSSAELCYAGHKEYPKDRQQKFTPMTHEQAIKLVDYILAKSNLRQTLIDICDIIDWKALAASAPVTTPGRDEVLAKEARDAGVREILELAARACEANFDNCDKSNVACHKLDAEVIRALGGTALAAAKEPRG
jgi:hypothetical protein